MLSLWSPESGQFDEDPNHCALIKGLVTRTNLNGHGNHFNGILNVFDDVSELSDDFFAAVQTGDNASAYKMLSTEFKRATSEDQLQSFLKASGLEKTKGVS